MLRTEVEAALARDFDLRLLAICFLTRLAQK